MSVLIKGMEMPKNCYECLVRNQGFSGDGMKCGKTGSVLSWYDGNRKRMDDCPLVPVPPHGKYIDADALIKEVNRFCDQYDAGIISTSTWVNGILHAIFNAPTVIEAEESET